MPYLLNYYTYLLTILTYILTYYTYLLMGFIPHVRVHTQIAPNAILTYFTYLLTYFLTILTYLWGFTICHMLLCHTYYTYLLYYTILMGFIPHVRVHTQMPI